VTATISIASLLPNHRSVVEEIVRATGVFSEAEIDVALELFDAASIADSGHGTWDMGARESSSTRASPTSNVPSPPSEYEFLGAFEGDSLVGYVCFGPAPSTEQTYDLYWIAVHPDAQRGGAGGALMDEVERLLQARRGRLLVIETSSRDEYAPTRRFYQKRGYQESARLRDFYASGDDRVVLTKRLLSLTPKAPLASLSKTPAYE
jgi:ribosomal protein S18 acetylase RimI-like enzyme